MTSPDSHEQRKSILAFDVPAESLKAVNALRKFDLRTETDVCLDGKWSRDLQVRRFSGTRSSNL